MTEPTKTYGCVVYRNLPGHIKVCSRSVYCTEKGDLYLLSPHTPVKPDPTDYHQHGRFVQYDGSVYYIGLNYRVYETNIEPGREVRFRGKNVAYMSVDDYRLVPVTMRKLEKVEWLFL
jgi:hypothetical protein